MKTRTGSSRSSEWEYRFVTYDESVRMWCKLSVKKRKEACLMLFGLKEEDCPSILYEGDAKYTYDTVAFQWIMGGGSTLRLNEVITKTYLRWHRAETDGFTPA